MGESKCSRKGNLCLGVTITNQVICRDRSSDLLGPRASRPPSLNAKESDLNETFALDRGVRDAGGTPAVPGKSLDR